MISYLTFLLPLVILVVGLYAVYRITQVLSSLALTLKSIDVNFKVVPPSSDPAEQLPELEIPKEVLDYCELESEEWARIAFKNKAKRLYAKEQNWNVVLRQLKAEA